MSSSARAVLVLSAALAVALASPSARAAAINSNTESQTSLLPLTATDFAPGNPNVSPMSIVKFDDHDGSRVLDAVNLSFHASIQNQFSMSFLNAATITTSVATGNADTPGPAITIYQPDQVSPLLTVKAANDPSFLSRSVTYNPPAGSPSPQAFSSTLSPSSPFYIAPAMSEASNSIRLTSPSDLALFSGQGNLQLPVAATAFSSFSSSSGNGFGKVTTQASADITVAYEWHDKVPASQTVPEPAACLLWGLGAAALGLKLRRRRAAA